MRNYLPASTVAYPTKTLASAAAPLTRKAAKVGNMLWTIILIILILMLVGSLPTWPYSGGWGYYPSGGLGLIVVIVILVLLLR